MISISSVNLGVEEANAVAEVLASGNLAQGRKVELFESEFSKRVEGRHVIALNSGTSALHLMLLAHGIGPGSEVIVPSFTFAATANAVALTGAKPVFCDIDSKTFNMSAPHASSLITPRTAALLPVHLFGQMFDVEAFQKLASRNGLLLLEDAAQAHIASANGKFAGTVGDSGAFSFYPTKNMTTGEGGAVVTKDSQVARKVRLLRNQGMEQRYKNEMVGFNNRMTEIAAAIGLAQLEKLDKFTRRRRSNADFLSNALGSGFSPFISEGYLHVFHQFTVTVPAVQRDLLVDFFAQNEVGVGIYYPTPVHELDSFKEKLDLPHTKNATESVLSLPVHPGLSKEDLEKVASVAKEGLNKYV